MSDLNNQFNKYTSLLYEKIIEILNYIASLYNLTVSKLNFDTSIINESISQITNSDGVLSPEIVCKKYKQEGYDFLCISDHFVGAFNLSFSLFLQVFLFLQGNCLSL